MKHNDEVNLYIINYKEEINAVYLYERLEKNEKNESIKLIYKKLADTERKHAALWQKKIEDAGYNIPAAVPGWRTKILGWLAERFKPGFVIPTLAGIESSAASGYEGQPDAEKAGLPAEERSHARIFNYLAQTTAGLDGNSVAHFEGRHKAGGGNALRAGVLGANDGLVSIFSLLMGVAGAGVPSKGILITGFAGLLAGALSMALGEWLSVQSSRELYLNQISIEQKELQDSPQEELEELSLIYQAKGMDSDSARNLAKKLLLNEKSALDTLSREELGINPDELGGSAWEAAFTSFCLFSVGAIIPVLPFIFLSGTLGIIVSIAASICGLFIIGAFITLLTGKNPVLSGVRQVLIGLAASAVTFTIGRLLGVNLS